ncbi:MAG: protein translocase subunit SecD [Deltaproteobacteria bacterium]|nr:protein translocase subunit SecD [Deltaproteobacteria bacterium]
MTGSIRWRLALIGVLILGSGVVLLPTLDVALPAWFRALAPIEPINLGLDLQGGMYLGLQVETEKAVEGALERYAAETRDVMRKKQISYATLERVPNGQIRVSLTQAQAGDLLVAAVRDELPGLRVLGTGTRDGQAQVTLGLDPREASHIQESAVRQALETIRNRVDQFGVREPMIVQEGDRGIIIQLPGLRDPQRAINLIGKTAQLEFKLVDEQHSLEEALRGSVPEGSELLYERKTDRQTGQVTRTPYLLKKRALMTGEGITDARVQLGQFSEPYVSLTFDSRGARAFERITGEHVKERLAIVLDGTVYSAPVIQERISGGRAQITGQFTEDEVRDLAIVLRAGALPAPVKINQNVTVGPSLGRDSIEKGVRATVIGGLAVILFMLLYYRLSGLIADLALFLNVLFLMAALAALNATLTLPGIAGIALTVGMAVDSNVLIFERIREELRAGKPIRAAVEAGYDRALVAIIDSHVTTLITAVVLFQFGTGPIKGFAVTLSLGVLINLFTAVVSTRVIFDMILRRRVLKTLSI